MNVTDQEPFTRKERAQACWRWHRDFWLHMSEEERADERWRTQRSCARTFHWDDSQVGRVRRVLEHNELDGKKLGFPARDLDRWSHVRWLAKQGEKQEWNRQQWIEKRVRWLDEKGWRKFDGKCGLEEVLWRVFPHTLAQAVERGGPPDEVREVPQDNGAHDGPFDGEDF